MKPEKPIKRRKPRAARREATILIRCTEEEKATLTAAAARKSLDLSGWMRSLALEAAGQS